MPNAFYAKGRQAFCEASINYPSDTIKLALVSSAYTPNLTTDQFWSTASGAVIGTPVALTSKTDVNSILSSANVSYGGWSTTQAVAIILYKDTGVAATSPLINYMDGKETVTCAFLAGAASTSVRVDPLLAPIANGAVIAFSGGTSVTLTAPASAGDRSITVSSTSGTIAAGETGPAAISGSGIPITGNGNTVTVTPDPSFGWGKL